MAQQFIADDVAKTLLDPDVPFWPCGDDKSGMGSSAAVRGALAAAWNRALRLVCDTAVLCKSKLSASDLDRERIDIHCQLSEKPRKTRLRHADADLGSLPMNLMQKHGKFPSVSGLVPDFRNSLPPKKDI